MNKDYFLQELFEYYIGIKHTINKSEYETIKKANEVAKKTAWINERYFMIVDNYDEFIISVNQALQIVYKDIDQKDMIYIGQNYIRSFNRKLFNILSAVRLYIDQTRHDLSKLHLKVSKDDFAKLTSKQYDLKPGYQIMEMLRNYMQHECMVIDSIVWVKPFFKNQSDYIPIIIAMDLDRLRKIDAFKKKIKANMINTIAGKSFNILYFLHEYLLGINEIHKEFLTLIGDVVNLQHNDVAKIFLRHYENIPKEVGVIAPEGDFLYIDSYFKKAKQTIINLDEKINYKKIFMGANIAGNYERIEIRYNI